MHATSHPAVVCFVRTHPAGDVVQVYNVSDSTVALPAHEVQRHASGLVAERISGQVVTPHGDQYVLRPYAAWWLTARGRRT